jgi:GNAT superfamily N-acetyltransferase
MCTSAEGAEAAAVSLRALPYDDPLAQELVEKVQQEYVLRYGGRDAAAVRPEEFTPPQGAFLVAEVGGVAAGCGAWRALAEGVAEVKRVYVEPRYRRRGIARTLMAALEAGASRAGLRSVVLNTGRQQPEAVALYAELGYLPVAGYGVYACAPDAVFLGKDLPPAGGTEVTSWAS